MDEQFLREALALAEASVASGGGPFGAVVVRDGQVIARGNNRVVPHNDPTAHAEIVALRNACTALDDFRLTGCTLYVNCEPCPMCFSAAYWARIERIVFAASREDAAQAGFDDVVIHEQVALPVSMRGVPMVQLLRDESARAFELWRQLENRVEY
jgi:guanine deaminase